MFPYPLSYYIYYYFPNTSTKISNIKSKSSTYYFIQYPTHIPYYILITISKHYLILILLT